VCVMWGSLNEEGYLSCLMSLTRSLGRGRDRSTRHQGGSVHHSDQASVSGSRTTLSSTRKRLTHSLIPILSKMVQFIQSLMEPFIGDVMGRLTQAERARGAKLTENGYDVTSATQEDPPNRGGKIKSDRVDSKALAEPAEAGHLATSLHTNRGRSRRSHFFGYDVACVLVGSAVSHIIQNYNLSLLHANSNTDWKNQ